MSSRLMSSSNRQLRGLSGAETQVIQVEKNGYLLDVCMMGYLFFNKSFSTNH